MKYLILLAARGGTGDQLAEAVRSEATRLASETGGAVTAMVQVPDDPFGTAVPNMRAFDATIDIRTGDDGASASDDRVAGALAGLGERLGPVVHADLSGALAGRDHVVIAPPATPVRYQYVMRRRADLSRDQYFDHYVNRHAAFGLRTPGIEGYVQFHVDPDASAKAAAAAGVGVWRADSVSELHLASVATFLEALARDNPAAEAGADEERFVDRPNSVMFTSTVVWRS